MMLKEDCKAWVEELVQKLQQVLDTVPVQNIANPSLVANSWFSIGKADSTDMHNIREKLQRLHEKLKEFAIILSDSAEIKTPSTQEDCYSYIQGAVENIDNHVKQFLKNNTQATKIPIADILIVNENMKNFIKAYDHAFFINQEKFLGNSADYFKEILADLERTYSNDLSTRAEGSSYAIALNHIQKYINFSQLLATKKTAKTESERSKAAMHLNLSLFHHNNYKAHQNKDKYEVMHNTVENTIKQYVYIYKRIKQASIQHPEIMIKFFNAHSELCLEGSTELSDWAAKLFLLNEVGAIVDIITDPRYKVSEIVAYISKHSIDTMHKDHKLFDVYKKIEKYVMDRWVNESQKIDAATTNDEKIAILCSDIPEKVKFNNEFHEVNKAARHIVHAYLISIDLIDKNDGGLSKWFKF